METESAIRKSLEDNLNSSAQNTNLLSKSEKVIESILHAVSAISDAYKRDGCLYAIGNGGSAADSQHIVAEFVSKLNKNRTPIRAYSLTVDTSILTAIGNDYGYQYSFSRQVEAAMKPNDILLAISTSGNSRNVLEAMKSAKKIGAKTILLTGGSGGEAVTLADTAIIAPGKHTAEIQEAHIVIYHNLCYLVEKNLVASGICHYV